MFIEARIGGRANWYDFVFLALAGVIVYPDEILDWIGARTGRHFNWKHVVLLEILTMGILATVVLLLLPAYPRLRWWVPLIFVALLGVFRNIKWMISNSFGDFP